MQNSEWGGVWSIPPLLSFKGEFQKNILHVCVHMPECIYVYHIHAWFLRRPEEVWDTERRVTDDCKLPHGCWDLCSSAEPPLHLTMELSFQPALFPLPT